MTERRLSLVQRLTMALALLVAPALASLAAWLLGWLSQDLAIKILMGIAVADVGGVGAGFVEERLLGRPRNDAEQLVGIAAATTIGVLTIGYLYLVHIRGPMSTVGNLNRAVEQVLIFLGYLTSQAAGMLLSMKSTSNQ
ncbi:MAG: hypothetical protein ACP5JG_00635 [Anaerolineae bacterium]